MGVVSSGKEPVVITFSQQTRTRAKMARVLFTLSMLLVVLTTVRVFGAPTQSNESPNLDRQKRTFRFTLLGDRNWEEFRRWPFITTTPMKTMMSLFREEESTEKLVKRLDALENGHKQIVEYLKKVQDTMSGNRCRPSSIVEKQPESVPSSAVPKIDDRVQTDAPTQSNIPASTPAKVTTPELKVKVEPSTATSVKMPEVKVKAEPMNATSVSAAEVEEKVVPSMTANTTSAEVEVKVQPASDVTPTEVEDKVESSTTNISEGEDKIESLTPTKIVTEVEDKKGASSRPQEDNPSNEESTENKVSIEKIETPQVDTDAPAVTAASNFNQEATTRVENNEFNNILI